MLRVYYGRKRRIRQDDKMSRYTSAKALQHSLRPQGSKIHTVLLEEHQKPEDWITYCDVLGRLNDELRDTLAVGQAVNGTLYKRSI